MVIGLSLQLTQGLSLWDSTASAHVNRFWSASLKEYSRGWCIAEVLPTQSYQPGGGQTEINRANLAITREFRAAKLESEWSQIRLRSPRGVRRSAFGTHETTLSETKSNQTMGSPHGLVEVLSL
jgi:hypothetical protein